MKAKILLITSLFLVAGFIFGISGSADLSEYKPIVYEPSDSQKSNEAFDKMMDVLTHQRCMNCHPNDNIPKQGDDNHPHYFGMARGADDNGFQATKCATCHQSENNAYSGVPGAPHWALAPASMGMETRRRCQRKTT